MTQTTAPLVLTAFTRIAQHGTSQHVSPSVDHGAYDARITVNGPGACSSACAGAYVGVEALVSVTGDPSHFLFSSTFSSPMMGASKMRFKTREAMYVRTMFPMAK